MEPSSDHELEIARLVDQWASEYKLPPSAIAKIAGAIPFPMSESEVRFLVCYIVWRQDHPINQED
jgi:hypothetical protein